MYLFKILFYGWLILNYPGIWWQIVDCVKESENAIIKYDE